MSEYNMSAADFITLYQNGDLKPSQVIDVREPEEWDVYHLERTCLIPMQTIPQQVGKLPTDEELYILCAHGVRSLHVTEYLLQSGYEKVINIEGGTARIYGLLEGRT